MAFYTNSSYQLNLPRTPDAFSLNMNVNGLRGWRTGSSSSLKDTKLSSGSSSSVASSSGTTLVKGTIRTQGQGQVPLTPPMSTNFEARTTGLSSYSHSYPSSSASASSSASTSTSSTTRSSSHSGNMTLPPIAHLERHLPPLTPPEDVSPYPHVQGHQQYSNAPSQHPHGHQQARPSLPASLPVPLPRIASSDDIFFSGSSSSSSSKVAVVQPPPQPAQSQMEVAAVPLPQPAVSHSQQTQVEPAPPSYIVDWLDFTRTRSAHFIAEKTCEMICYLWFASPTPSKVGSSSPSTSPEGSPLAAQTAVSAEGVLTSPAATTAPSTLQLLATTPFVSFMQKLLETTQVSQSVIVLSLHYIYRLKEKNRWTPAQPGSEFRIAVAGLMMGNKFLDDNTYTNKTWSEVSGIALEEINRMEREFLVGVDFNLYVDKATYEAWLNLLKGLVLAKERDCRRWGGGHSSRAHGHGRRGVSGRERERERDERERRKKMPVHTSSNGRTSNAAPTIYGYSRARSTSPTVRSRAAPVAPSQIYAAPQPTTQVSYPPSSYVPSSSALYAPHASQSQSTASSSALDYPSYGYSSGSHSAYSSPTPRSSAASSSANSNPIIHNGTPGSTGTGAKRTAEAAFSPTSATFAHVPSKRPLSMHGGISLRIPDTQVTLGGGLSASPLEGLALSSFERMSLSSSGQSPMKDLPADKKHGRRNDPSGQSKKSTASTAALPQTLSTAYAYSVNEERSRRPQNLYFYALACSPVKHHHYKGSERDTDVDADEDQVMSGTQTTQEVERYPNDQRKARLRYHQPPPPYTHVPYAYADLNAGVGATGRLYQPPAPAATAASTNSKQYQYTSQSGHNQTQTNAALPAHQNQCVGHTSTSTGNSGALPHFRDDVWARPPAPATSYASTPITQEKDRHPDAQVYDEDDDEDEDEDEDDDDEEDEEMDYFESPVPALVSASGFKPSLTHSSSTHSSHSSVSSASTVTAADAYTPPSATVPSAPFANAGPPGVRVQFYNTPYYGYQEYQAPSSSSGTSALVHAASASSAAPSGGYGYGYGYDYGYGYSTPPLGYPSVSASSATATVAPTSDAVHGSSSASAYAPSYPQQAQSQYSSPVSHTSGHEHRGYSHVHAHGYASQYSSPLVQYGYVRRG